VNILEEQAPQQGKVIDFEEIISKSLMLPLSNENDNLNTGEYHENEGTINEVFDDKPRKIRCGGDKLGSHVPESLKTKIKQNEYVNFSSLIKGPVELDMFDAGVTLGLANSLNLVTRPRVKTDKISSIEKWSDAFLVFSSIYLSAHQEHTQDILHYMYVIREAASNFGGIFWRTYDEQFRLRQATEFMPWSSINSDLWLRCFSGAARTQSSSDNMPAKQNQSKPPTIRATVNGSIVDTHISVLYALLNSMVVGNVRQTMTRVPIAQTPFVAHFEAQTTGQTGEAHQEVHSEVIVTNTPSIFNLAPSPINICQLRKELVGYNQNEARFLLNGFLYGFSLEYEGPRQASDSKNLRSAAEFPEFVQEKIDKEIKLNRVAGPFKYQPIFTLRVSPIGLVPKKSSSPESVEGFRLIHYLSYPEGQSLNDFIDQKKMFCSV
jgi:hypothetical protein